MASSLPPIMTVVNHAKEMSKLTHICRCFNLLCRFHFLWLWLDTVTSDLVSQALQIVLGKEAFAQIGPEVGLLWASKDLLCLGEVVRKGAITNDEDVINAGAGVV